MTIIINTIEEFEVAQQHGLNFERAPQLPFVLDTDETELSPGFKEHLEDLRAAMAQEEPCGC